ncbi:unknown protein [Waddlia chondrophila 2032/99]|uniref:Uncharacterized protein n=1 Tax=Waddlia chondrophila 2032/99 TaxID=765953 RepID=F8LEF3_9BACT|nr:unknown protein [Waddlia chondrophila 2032/99]
MENHNWDSDVSLIDDWLEVNWKLLIERELLEGNGVLAPLSLSVSDIFFSSSLKKYAIEARITEHEISKFFEFRLSSSLRFRLFGFSTKLKNSGFGLYPPFDTADLVLDSKKEIYSIPFEYLEFYLVEYAS